MDRSAPLVRSVAATVWTSEAGVTGTLIDGFHVVVPAGVPMPGDYPVTFANDHNTQAHLTFALPELGLDVMELVQPVDAPPLATLGSGKIQSWWQGQVREGEASGDVVHFDLPPHARDPLGAPVVYGDSLNNVVGAHDGVSGWRLIPATDLREVISRRFFDRFGASARRVLAHARGWSDGNVIHNEHLVMGLYENPEGSTRRLLDSRTPPVSRENLLETLRTYTKTRMEEHYELETLQSMPWTLSTHAREAIANAVRIARENDEPEVRPRHLLLGILSLAKCDVRDALTRLGLRAADVQLKDAIRNAGYVSDTAEGRDRLGVGREAAALANVLGSSRVEPPIAVGLLGNWGSGKSFFMKQLQSKLKDVEQRGDEDSCSSIIQIWFNAWHYIDANLWASLTCEIFDKLDEELRRRDPGFEHRDTASERAQCLAESAQAKSERDAAAAKREEADKELAQIAEVRQSLADDEQVAARVGVLTLASGIARENDDVQKLVKAAKDEAEAFAKKHNLDVKTVEELHGTAGLFKAVFLAAKRNGPYALTILIALLVITPILGAIAIYARDQIATWLGSIGVIGTLATAIRIGKEYLPEARKLLARLREVMAKKDELIAAERKRAMEELEQRSTKAAESRAQAAQQEQEAAARLRDAEQKLLALQPSHQMRSFVRERRESTDYSQHLGVVAKAHDDFARLSLYLKNLRDESGQRVVERIVLYIDDLDRCPEAKVFDVLQAVHLLLAFPLFVVVVGVDSRWLLHSLKAQMKQFRTNDKDADAIDQTLWESTPLNYLEKIFQIPFTLRPMPEQGFDDLIEDLTRTSGERSPAKEGTRSMSNAVSTLLDAAARGDSPADGNVVVPAPGVVLFREPVRVPVPQGIQNVPARKPIPLLSFTRGEIEYMKALYTLMPSPRGVKRFVNLYRIVRGLLDEYRLKPYLDEQNGEYEAALLLLAMLTGFPEETTEVLHDLATRTIASAWWVYSDDFAEKKANDADLDPAARARWAMLRTKLKAIHEEGHKPADSRNCDHFSKWAPEIARFSFHSGRIASDYRGPSIMIPAQAKTTAKLTVAPTA